MTDVESALRKFLELFDKANLDPKASEGSETKFVKKLRKNNEELFNSKKNELKK